jgi:predicted SnoaL-like aldol condensation-catalyzing enzyme
MRTLMLALAAMALAASPALAADARQQERDKKTVVDFYEKALNQKDFDAAAKYLGPRYTQHNPNAADGPEGLRAFLGFLKENSPTRGARSSACSPTATT